MTNGWSEYQRLVLGKLEQVDSDIKELERQVTLLRIDFAQQKVKAGMWGAVAGMVPALVAVLAIWVAGVPGA